MFFNISAPLLTCGTGGVVAALLVAPVAAVRLAVAEEEPRDATAVRDALGKTNEKEG